jgi:hypothetical protein
LGRDFYTVPFDQITQFLFLNWIQPYFYTATMLGIKVSIVLLYLRLFPEGVYTWFRRSCYVLIVVLVIAAVSIFISQSIACEPVSYAWLYWDVRTTSTKLQ